MGVKFTRTPKPPTMLDSDASVFKPNATIDRTEVLRRVRLFDASFALDFSPLAKRIVEQHYAKDEIVFHEEDPCEGLFLIASGAIKIFKTSRSGREQVMGIHGTGQTIGDLPLFDEAPYPASAMALEDSLLYFVPRNDFKIFLATHPEISLSVMRALAQRVRKLIGLVEELSLMEVHQRLARLLLDWSRKKGKASRRGVTFTLDFTNQDIAAQIGTVRELVSRILSHFRRKKLIAIQGRKVTILNSEGLKTEFQTGKR